MSNEEQHQESEFDKAFSESDEEREETTAEEEGGADTEKEADTSIDDRGEAGETVGGDENDGEEEDWKAKAEEERMAREKAEQKMRSWEGRLRKSSEELEQERQAREELDRRLAALEQQSKDGDRQKLQEWMDDYGDDEEFSHITSVVRDRLKALDPDTAAEKSDAAGQSENADQDAAGKTELSEADEEVKAHFATIEEKHSDWKDLVEDLDAWIEELPGKQALKYSRVKEEGTAEEVVAMLDELKASKQRDDKHNDDDDADAMAAVRHRSGGKRPKGRADKNDFDGAWTEAVGQE